MEYSIDESYFIEGKHLTKLGRCKVFINNLYNSIKSLKSLIVNEKILYIYDKGIAPKNVHSYMSVHTLDKSLKKDLLKVLSIMYGNHLYGSDKKFNLCIKTNVRTLYIQIKVQELRK